MQKDEILPYNTPKPIIIGDHVWVGYNVKMTKGTEIANDTIIGTSTVVSGKFLEPNTIIAGNPAKVIKRNIKWDCRPTQMYKDTLEKTLAHSCN